MLSIETIKKKYGTEMAVIIYCCRVFFETSTAEGLTVFVEQHKIDWDKFFGLLFVHKVRPVVYKVMYQLPLPGHVKLMIQQDRTEIAKQSLKQAIETERIILLLKKNGITALPYKGTAYSKQFFGDLISRESSDIDVIISKADIGNVIEILKLDDYLPELDEVYQYLGIRYTRYYKDYNFNKFNGGARIFHVEMHWAIAEAIIDVDPSVDKYLNDMNEFYFIKDKIDALTMHAHFAAMLVHHSVKDNFNVLKNVVDITQGFRSPEISANGTKLMAEFDEMGLKRALAVASLLSKQLMGVSLGGVDTDSDKQIAGYFCEQLGTNSGKIKSFKKEFVLWMKGRAMLYPSAVQRAAFYIKCFTYRFIPGPKDFRLVRLPKPLFFIYYIIKPFRTLITPMDKIEEKKKLIPTK